MGAGLLAKTVCQLQVFQLIHRFREQARSNTYWVYTHKALEHPHSFYCHSRPRSTIVATVPVHF